MTLAVLCVMSCADERENFMVKDGMLLSTDKMEKNVAAVSVYDGSYSLKVYKSGKGTEAGDVKVEVVSDILDTYNETNRTNYKALPANLVTLSKDYFEFKVEEVSKLLTIYWDPIKVAEAIGTGDETSTVIPIKLTNSNLDIWDGTDYALIKVMKPVVSINQERNSVERSASFSTSYVDRQVATLNLDEALAYDVNITAHIDETLVAAWNEANGVNYDAAPDKMIKFPMTMTIPAGATSVEFNYEILNAEYYKLLEGKKLNGVVAPVRIASAMSNNLAVGISSEDVFYVVVTPPVYPASSFPSAEIKRPAFPGTSHIDTFDGQVAISAPLSGLDSYMTLEYDASYGAVWNAANNKNYVVADASMITLPSEVLVPADKTIGDFKFKCDRTKLPAAGTFDGVVAPFKITSLIVNGVPDVVENQVCYLVLTEPENNTIMGNGEFRWKVLEGQRLGDDPGMPNAGTAGWYEENYPVSNLIDGDMTTAWRSWIYTENKFPLTFVFDMGVAHRPEKMWKRDWHSWQGQYRNINFYVAEEYDGDNTQWTLVCEAHFDFGWVSGGQAYSYDCGVSATGRYLKVELVDHSWGSVTGPNIDPNDPYSNYTGLIAEFYFEGQ